jgi:HEAT repeat protein
VVPGANASIERALGSADAEDRRQATAELARLPVEEALPLLVRSLGDEDWRVRKEATLAARAFGGAPPLLDVLVGAFAGGENVGLRNAAVEVLAGVGADATPVLAAALPRLDPDGRKLVVETLGRGRDPAALGALEAALADTDENVRQAVIEAIAGLGALARDRVPDLLLARLGDHDNLVRLTALEGLTALDIPIPWAHLEPLFEEPTLRAAALSAAALVSSPEAAGALARVLARARGGLFAQALRALGRLAEGPLAPSVADALRAGGPALGERLVTAALAGRPGEPPGAPLDSSDDVAARRAVALQLAAMAGAPGVVDAAVAALGEDLLAEPARRALAALGPAALPAMFERLAGVAVPPEARAALVDVIADVLDSGDPTASGDALPGGAPDPRAALRGAARDPDRPRRGARPAGPRPSRRRRRPRARGRADARGRAPRRRRRGGRACGPRRPFPRGRPRPRRSRDR